MRHAKAHTHMGAAESKPEGERSLVGRGFTLRNKLLCKVDRVLAKGGFSTVYSCNSDSIALKQVLIVEPDAELEAMSEIRAHKLLGSSELVSQLMEVQVIMSPHLRNPQSPGRPSLGSALGKEILMFFPLYKRGSLGDALLAMAAAGGNQQPNWLLPCARAVEYIHSKGLVHCDIKTINFMLLENDSCVLIDFGSSRQASEVNVVSKTQALDEQERAERMSSAAYRAPELWDVPVAAELDLRAADVFALGCVFYACLFSPLGFTPFEHPVQGLLPLAARTASVPRFTSKSENPMDQLVRSMLSKDPKLRPTAAQIASQLEAISKQAEEDDFEVHF
ncbi:hypothetical protein BASA81_008838 [Batrachochytrium salamandrivorans]|nr:hypothetical protein BASA81_008838 [Batrachochytrium salamandrivorans]